jgi:DoxX-like protein
MSANEQSISAARRVTGNILIGLPGVALIGSAAAKLVHVPKVVEQMAASGFAGERLTFIAVLEVFCAVLFLIPSTRAAGLLLVSAFLGGAIATHLQHGQSVVQPGVFLAVLWVGAWLRHPQIFWSISASTLGTIQYSTADRRPRAHGQIQQ